MAVTIQRLWPAFYGSGNSQTSGTVILRAFYSSVKWLILTFKSEDGERFGKQKITLNGLKQHQDMTGLTDLVALISVSVCVCGGGGIKT